MPLLSGARQQPLLLTRIRLVLPRRRPQRNKRLAGLEAPVTARAERHEVGGGISPALTPRIDMVRLQMRPRAPALDAGAVPGDDLLG
jgi:hypothetical protein